MSTKPYILDNRLGDQLELRLEDVAYTVKWVSPYLSIHYSQETGEVVGVTIEAYSKIEKVTVDS